MKFTAARQLSNSGRGLLLFAMALLAMSVAFVLSAPGMGAGAWFQSPGSPISPVPPALTQPLQTPAGSPTVLAITPTPDSETPFPSGSQPSPNRGRPTAALVVGGIVLAGLIMGAAVLLMRGQPPDNLVS